MAKMQVLLLTILLCSTIASIKNKDDFLDEVETIDIDEPVLDEVAIKAEESFPKPEEEVPKADEKDVAKELMNEHMNDPIFHFLAKVIGGLVHVVAGVGSAVLGFAAGAIAGAAEGVAALISGTLAGAINGAIHHSGVGIQSGAGKEGWNHPVEIKNTGNCIKSVSESLCERMAASNHQKNSEYNKKGVCRRLSEKSAYKAPHGCFTYKNELWYNAYGTGRECSKTKVCVCEVCAKKTKEGKCCHLPFQYKGKLYTDCTTTGCWIFCKPWCGTSDVVGGQTADHWGRCSGWHLFGKKKDAEHFSTLNDAPETKKELITKVADVIQDHMQDMSVTQNAKDEVEVDWNDSEL